MSRKEHTSISVLREITAIRKRPATLIKPGLLRRVVGMDAETGSLKYEVQPPRKTRRAIAAINQRRR